MTAVALDTRRPGVPFSRLLLVELRKMFDTRAGFWLMAASVIISTLITIGIIAFAPDAAITYDTFGAAIGAPLGLLLPVIAILSVTGEWTQRTGLVTFALAPHRATVIAAKATVSVLIGTASAAAGFSIGALGNVVGAAVHGIDPVWQSSLQAFGYIVLAQVLSVLVGFMLGSLIRSSAGAIVAYVAYNFLLPAVSGALAHFTSWFSKAQPWVDFQYATNPLYDGGPHGQEWAHLGVTGLIWFVVPMAIAVWAILRSEVK